MDLLGNGGDELAGVGFTERVELVGLVLGEELEELDEAFVQVSPNVLLENVGKFVEIGRSVMNVHT